MTEPQKTTDDYLPDSTLDHRLMATAANESVTGSQANKYELSDETITLDGGTTLYRIRALKDIDAIGVKAGDPGGFVESTNNLSQEGDA